MNKMEVLSPAGNMDCLFQAVNNGADAVYLGLKSYSARGKIDNFNNEQLKSAIFFAHIHNVKVYLAVNTLIKDDEMEQAIKEIKVAVSYGIDAIIVQDLGLVYELKRQKVCVELHASTQLAVNNLYGAKVLENLGFKRVVLSRETQADDIKKIKQNTNLQVEYFVQGALCVCFSGNCYLSSMLKNESGNRGKCLQLCRLPYSLYQSQKLIKNGYLLSAKDINLSKKLKDLYDLGVDSIKIEGRARRSGYVAITTAVYKSIINNDFYVNENEIKNLALAFNRGDFTEAYLNGNEGIIDNSIQGHRGIFIGKVIKVDLGKKFNQIYISTDFDLQKSDGIKIIRDNKEICSFIVTDISKNKNIAIVNTQKLAKVGDNANLILSNSVEKEFLTNVKKEKVDFVLTVKSNDYALLKASSNGVSIIVKSDVIFEKAISAPSRESDICEILKKLSSTEFCAGQIKIIKDDVFVLKHQLKNLRNIAIKQLSEKINDIYIINNKKSPLDCMVSKSLDIDITKQQKVAIVNENTKENIASFDKVVLFPSVYDEVHIQTILSRINNKSDKYLLIPPLLTTKECDYVKKLLDKFNLSVYATNISGFSFNNDKILISPLLNVFNTSSIKLLNNLGATGICLSSELNIKEMEDITSSFSNVFIYAKGKFPVMTLKHCPIKNNIGGSCTKCQYSNDMFYQLQSGEKLKLKRYKVLNCYFNLLNENKIDLLKDFSEKSINYIVDFGEL